MIDRDSLLLAGLTDSEIRAMVRRVRQARDFQANLRLPKPRRKLSIWKVWRPGSARSVQPSVSRNLADTPATIALSELGELQNSHLRYIRSLKRAESLLDALLAPYIRAAVSQDYLPPHPHPKPHWREWMNDGKPSPKRSAEKIRKRKPKRKPSHQPSTLPLCGPHPSDYRRCDGLAAARVLVAESIPQRNAQATYRPFSRENCWQWQESADVRGLPLVAAVPGNDTACDCIARHWEEVRSQWLAGNCLLPDSMPLPIPHRESEAAEPIEIPADWPLSPNLRKFAGLIGAGASDRELERECGIDRKDIPQIVELIRSKLPPPLPAIPSDEAESPSVRRAIQREAVAQLRR